MRRIIAIISLSFMVSSCALKPKVEKPKFPDDQKLLISWRSFKDALNRSDTTILMSLSNSCIMCTLCSSEQTSDFISAGEFYHDHFGAVFNAKLLSFINDSTKLNAAYENSTFLERDSCLSINKTIDSAKLAYVFVGIPIPHQEEGLTVLIHFIETKSRYNFFGVSTIP